MRRVITLAVFAVLMAVALSAGAHHVSDGGTDESWSSEMNQETYWELRFGTECTKYENHNGFIPAEYDAAAVHDGQYVRVYPSTGPAFTALGPVNPANNRHHGAPHSWVMKCKITTTTTIPEPTTTVPEEPTTTLITTTSTTGPTPEDTTTTSSTTLVPPSSSTTTPESPTTTTTEGATTTSAPTESTTTLPDTSTVPDVSADWYASGTCYDDGGYIEAEWGEGITGVDVYMWDNINTPPDWYHVARWLEPGAYKTAVGSPTLFLLIPVVQTGYVADPAEIEVVVERCTPSTSQASSTSAPEGPQMPATPDLEELPMTGLPLHVWAILGLAAMGTGAFLVRRFSDG